MKHIILKTEQDFQKLNYLPFNRKYHVRNDLTENMNKFGFTVPIILLESKILTGKKSKWVIDGQNRCASAQYLNIPVDAMVCTDEERGLKTIEDIVSFVASMNSSSKPWSILNYAEAYNFLNYPEYHKLLTLTNSNPYTVNTIANMLRGFRSKTGSLNNIKNGTFIAHLEQETNYTLSLASRLSKYEKLTSRMLLALHYVASLKTFNEKKFTNTYKNKCQQIKELKLDDYTDLFSSWL